jgi:uncharacterized protein
MTLAWYGHLKFKESPLWIAIYRQLDDRPRRVLLSGARKPHGSYRFSTAQLKTIQEVITLVVFSIFSVTYLREQFRWNYISSPLRS